MLRTRVIPVLLMRNESLVKTIHFSDAVYVGDPCNTVRIFNELEVDELIFLDIAATVDKCEPSWNVLSEIASECFMPLGYGGGIRSLEDARRVFEIGYEKIILNSAAIDDPDLVTKIANLYGSQAVIVSIDVKTNLMSRPKVFSRGGRLNTGFSPVYWAKAAENLGAGEIMLTSISREGSWSGFDIHLIKSVADAVSIPVIAHGGCGNLEDIRKAVKDGNASSVALGSMIVFQKKGMGVLINFPDRDKLETMLA